MIHYTLTDEELTNFADDAVRAEIRTRIAEQNPEETVILIDGEGNEWDRVTGAPAAPSLLDLTDDELAQKAEEESQINEEAERLETVVRPLVMKRLMAEARSEVRAELREGTNAKLELQALKATLAKEKRESEGTPAQ